MPTAFLRFAAIALMLLVLLGAGAASFWGLGVPVIGQPDHRAGSVIGPRVIGGGPGVGK